MRKEGSTGRFLTGQSSNNAPSKKITGKKKPISVTTSDGFTFYYFVIHKLYPEKVHSVQVHVPVSTQVNSINNKYQRAIGK